MNRTKRWAIVFLACVFLMGGIFLNTVGDQGAMAFARKQASSKLITNPDKTVELKQISPKVWVHTTYGDYNGASRVPSNGLLIQTTKGLVLVDSTWNDALTKELLALIRQNFDRKLSVAVITHSHFDRMGGIRALQQAGIEVRTTIKTAKLAQAEGYPAPDVFLDNRPRFQVGSTIIETMYPGEGHTKDNITVWLPQHQVLFGGCLVKSLESKDMGNVDDANLKAWSDSIQKVRERYPNAEQVVPGHGKWGYQRLLTHTLDLLEQQQ
ncbi:metallo-beta-lactamase class B [Marininema mesophilum]|uniref:beta-lactamase n=1 Tax=Marininema mesophilum TaxID=1048340 RepID=A0A1H2W4S8_9BACL|nr:subclass B1 metallo-beta-lactamase [Marininema mesophilum]SDW75079.1 metallo-beta-lactamase class B [Marininema mesophilum]